ncbi:MAG TPA: hypothetical protein VM261_02070 [Kofleriaceae bacterium]|nr:hypothetical protein [Kofleriaceae bacterium]
MARQVHEVAIATAALIAALAAALASDASAQARCGTRTDAPATSSDGGVAALGKYLYWIAGTDGAPGTFARRFDVKAKQWETIPEPSGGRMQTTLVAFGGALYLIGGVARGITALDDVQRFDEKKCAWTSAGKLPWAAGSVMAAAAGDRIVIAGGRVDNGARSLRSLEIWTHEQAVMLDAKGKVTALPPIEQARADGAAVTVGKDVWVIGGRNVPKGVDTLGDRSRDVEILAPGAKEWTAGPWMPSSAEVYAVALPDKTIVAFGRDVMSSDRSMIYEPAKQAWREGKDRPESLEFLEGAAVIDGVIYVLGMEIVGGFGGTKTYRVATYDPRKDRWVIVNEVARKRP